MTTEAVARGPWRSGERASGNAEVVGRDEITSLANESRNKWQPVVAGGSTSRHGTDWIEIQRQIESEREREMRKGKSRPPDRIVTTERQLIASKIAHSSRILRIGRLMAGRLGESETFTQKHAVLSIFIGTRIATGEVTGPLDQPETPEYGCFTAKRRAVVSALGVNYVKYENSRRPPCQIRVRAATQKYFDRDVDTDVRVSGLYTDVERD